MVITPCIVLTLHATYILITHDSSREVPPRTLAVPFTQLGTVYYMYSSELCFKLVSTSYSGLSNCICVSLTTANIPHQGV